MEFNCRFGDPEAQPVMMRLKSDLTELCQLALAGQLDSAKAQWDEQPAVGVVLAAGGYPGNYKKGAVIQGLMRSTANHRRSSTLAPGRTAARC